MKKYDYSFQYRTSEGCVRGRIAVHQGRNGFVYLTLGNGTTELTKKQIEELGIDPYSIPDFDFDDFKKAYLITN